MNKNIIIVIGLVLIGAAFYGGIKYSQYSVANMRQARTGQFANVLGARGGMGGRGMGGGFTMGEILSQDAQSLTLKMQDGGSVIAFITASTTVMKTSTGSKSDLAVGTNVTITGSKNPDGSISASSIQLRSK